MENLINEGNDVKASAITTGKLLGSDNFYICMGGVISCYIVCQLAASPIFMQTPLYVLLEW